MCLGQRHYLYDGNSNASIINELLVEKIAKACGKKHEVKIFTRCKIDVAIFSFISDTIYTSTVACNKNYCNADIGPMECMHGVITVTVMVAIFKKAHIGIAQHLAVITHAFITVEGITMALVNVCSLRTMPVTTSQLIEQHKRVEKSFLHVRYKYESHCGKVLLTTLVNVTAIFTMHVVTEDFPCWAIMSL